MEPSKGWRGAMTDRLEKKMSTGDARLLLWRRCKDAGWSDNKTANYINRVLPFTDELPVSG